MPAPTVSISDDENEGGMGTKVARRQKNFKSKDPRRMTKGMSMQMAGRGKGKAVIVPTKVRKPHRWRPGTVALREIKKFQATVGPAIPFSPFSRLVREIAMRHKSEFRFQEAAIHALREAAEAHIVDVFSEANLTMLTMTSSETGKGGRITLSKRDIAIERRRRNNI